MMKKMMKKKGMARGGMKKKGYAKGGTMKKKGMAMGGMKKKAYARGGHVAAPSKPMLILTRLSNYVTTFWQTLEDSF